MLHKNIAVGEDSSHPPGYVQATDPGAVGAYRPWVDTSGGAGTWIFKLRNAADSAWETLVALGSATWASITGKPTTVSGFGITDAYTDSEVDTLLAAKEDVGEITASGPTVLTVGAVADGEYLKRSGSTIVGDTPAGGGGTVTSNTTPPRPAYVQSKIATGVGPITFSRNVASGSLILVSGSTISSWGTPSVSDSLGTAYTLIVSNTGGSNKVGLWAGVTTSSGANTVTFTGLTNDFSQVCIAEIAGYSATANVTNSAYNSTSPGTVSATTTVASTLLVAVKVGFANANTYAATDNWVIIRQVNGNDAMVMAIRFAISAGAYTSSLEVTAGSAADSPHLIAAFPVDTPSGADGDFHFYRTSGMMYGPRHDSVWGFPQGTFLALP